ncbi:ABC transporter substrate-binding protein [Candidatus Woesearchaeota archaeon]|nr:ABC transporter substrate-binding protein [Candidatus Woesearchaeota archaeon]
MTAMKKLTLMMLFLLVLCIFGCKTPEVTVEPIKIGYSTPLTGDLASLGEANHQGIELALEEINAAGGIAGRPVKLIVEDDRFEGSLTLKAYHKLVDIDNVDVMLTATYGGILTTANLADAAEVVVINTVDTAEELAQAGEYVFAIGIYDEGIGYALADFANEQDKTTGVMYLTTDPFIALVKDSFLERFEGDVVINEGYGPLDTDFRAQLMKAKDKGVELLVVLGFEEAGRVLKQAREMGIEADFAGIDIFGTNELFENSVGTAKGAYFTSWEAQDEEKYSAFLSKYVTKYGQEPEQAMFTVLGYDAMNIVANAMEQVIAEGKEPRGAALKQAIEQVKDYDGIAGQITMGKDGIVRSIREEMFQIIDKGEFEKI